MDIEEKILKYLYEVFPDPVVFSTNDIPLEKLGLDPEKDLLEYQKEFDRLKDKFLIEIDRIMISITFNGINYYEKKYLHPDYHYLKVIKIILEFIERLENEEYSRNSIPNTEILDKLKKEGIEMNNKELYRFFLALYKCVISVILDLYTIGSKCFIITLIYKIEV